MRFAMTRAKPRGIGTVACGDDELDAPIYGCVGIRCVDKPRYREFVSRRWFDGLVGVRRGGGLGVDVDNGAAGFQRCLPVCDDDYRLLTR